MTSKYDLAVIGAGPGGYVAAIRAAQLGLKMACIDKRSEPGGTCLNIGCIPSKTLLHSTEVYARLLKEGKELGINYSEFSFNFDQMMKRKQQVVQGLVNGVKGAFKQNHIDFIAGEARFINSNTLEISQPEHPEQLIEANYFILATGSEPIALPDLPFDEHQIVSSTGALNLSRVPQRMAVIGGGVIGVELASVYQRLGTEVTIIEMLDHICPAMDTSISQSLLLMLKKQGMQFKLSSRVVSAVVLPDEVVLTIQQGDQLSNLSVEVVLVAVGRKPYSKGLNLDKLEMTLTPRGFISVDEIFRTSQPHIFAIGDLIEGPMLAHRASAEGIAVAELIAGLKPFPINYLAIPNVIYTYPEVAAIGMTEAEAREAKLELKIGNSVFKGNPRARCSLEMEGFVKVIGEAHSGRLIGMHMIGAHASELIGEGMIAMDKKATLADLAYAVNAHPTLTEAIKEAALAALGHPIHV